MDTHSDRFVNKLDSTSGEELYKEVFHSSLEPTSISTIFGEFIDVNLAFCTASGFSRDEVIGKLLYTFDLWVDLSKRDQFFEVLKRDGVVNCFPAEVRNASRQVLSCNLHAYIVKIDGTFLVVISYRDVAGVCK